MSRIPKIDRFQEAFPSIYGLETGFCYEVLEEFTLEALTKYEEGGTINGTKYYDPVWTEIKIIKGDYLMASKNGLYASLNGMEGIVQVRTKKNSSESPSFNNIKMSYVKKIGSDIIEKKIMSLEERGKITYTRGI